MTGWTVDSDGRLVYNARVPESVAQGEQWCDDMVVADDARTGHATIGTEAHAVLVAMIEQAPVRADELGALLGIVLDLAAVDPHAFDRATGAGVRCALCDAEPSGGALTLAMGQHVVGCPWRRAAEYDRLLADGG